MKTSLMFLFVFFFCTSFLDCQTIQWQQLNGPHGGTALSFASNADGDIFAGSAYNETGVNRSTDGGLTWLMSSSGIYLAGRSVNGIVIADSNYIIIGTGSSNGNKIYRSTDNGDNWYGVADLGATYFAINDSGHIFALQTTGFGTVHKSTDNGITWQQVMSFPLGYQNDIAINQNENMFIVGSGVYRSTDYGYNWTEKDSGLFASGYVAVTSIAINDIGHLFVGCSGEYASNSGIFKSTNNGDSWTAVKLGIKIDSHHNIVINDIGDIFAGSYGWGIWKSTDNGLTWIQHNTGLGHFYFRSMHISSNGDIYAGEEGGGIYRSIDQGENWSQVGFSAAVVGKIAISPANENLFTAVSGISRSTDFGITWQPVNNGLANYDTKAIIIKEDGIIFCGADGGNYNPPPRVFRSTNNGTSWVKADTGLYGHPIYAMAVDDNGNIYAGDFDGVYKSTNNGGLWTNIGGPGGAVGLAFNSVGDFFLANGAGIYRKLSSDSIWTQVATGYYYSIHIGSNDYIYANEYRSTNNGETWTQMNSGGASPFAYTENSLGHLFAGHGWGVYRSTDYGDNWIQVNDGLTFTEILSLAVDSDGYLYAGTNGRSVFKTVNSTTTDVEEIKFEPISFYLEQNYPNPFNPSTVISYQSPESGNVTLKVYDVLGREVATLVDEYRNSGKYEIKFDAINLPSGVYFYQLKAGSFVQTRKMILLK